MRQKLNNAGAMLVVIGIFDVLIGTVLLLDNVTDNSLITYGLGVIALGAIMMILTRPKCNPPSTFKGKVAGVVLDINGKPELVFENGFAMPNVLSHMFFGEYFNYGDWPHDPLSGQRLKMVSMKELKDKDHEGRRIS